VLTHGVSKHFLLLTYSAGAREFIFRSQRLQTAREYKHLMQVAFEDAGIRLTGLVSEDCSSMPSVNGLFLHGTSPLNRKSDVFAQQKATELILFNFPNARPVTGTTSTPCCKKYRK